MAAPGVDKGKTHLVNQYFTPLAVLLVVNGVILTRPPSPVREITIGLLAFSILFNFLSNRSLDRAVGAGAGKLNLRVWVNFAVSALQVYLLGKAWDPIWLLLILTPVACAIYGARAKTLLFSFLSIAVILLIHGLRGPSSPVEWAAQLAHGAFIVLLSLALLELTRQLHGARDEVSS